VAVATRTFADRQHRLDPLRWPVGRRGALPRLAAVAALLLAALALLDPGGEAGAPAACPARGPTGTARPSPTPEGPSPAPAGPTRLPAGTVGVAVTPADPAVLGVLRAGDRVDLVAVSHDAEPTTIASGVLVLDTPRPADVGGGALYLALTPDRAREIVGLPQTVRFAILVRP
jgi:hypothetical protein